MSRHFPRRTAGALALALAMGPAQAFFEDICYLPDGGGVSHCTPLPASCGLTEPVSAQCRADALFVFLAVQNGGGGFDPDLPGRSTVHVDATHLLAQVVGFSADDAYWIAAYDEATDLASFVARDAVGVPLSDYPPTASLEGLTRTNTDLGGVLFHFHAPHHAGQPVDGLEPQVDDAHTEVMLAHLRRWALQTPGAPLCSGGFTVQSAAGDYATGDACYVTDDGGAGRIIGAVAALGQIAVGIDLPTGLQAIVPPAFDGGIGLNSTWFDHLVGHDVAPQARLGVYLHTLADRVSHHVCTDASELTGPDGEGVFTEYMDNPDCVQPLHALRHIWETGVDFQALDARSQTTPAALRAVFAELSAFAQARGIYQPAAANYGDVLLGQLADALEEPDARRRLQRLSELACSYGLAPFPGNPACAAL